MKTDPGEDATAKSNDAGFRMDPEKDGFYKFESATLSGNMRKIINSGLSGAAERQLEPFGSHVGEQWKSLEAPKTIFRTPIFSIQSEKFKCLRTGVVHDFVSLDTCNWVNIAAETPEGKLVVIRQFRHGTHTVEWEFPGGCMDSTDPDPATAGIRELSEETGYTGEDPVVIGRVYPNPAIQGNSCYTVFVRNARKTLETNLEPTECIEYMELYPEEIEEKIRSGEIAHALMLDAFFYYKLHKDTK